MELVLHYEGWGSPVAGEKLSLRSPSFAVYKLRIMDVMGSDFQL